MKCGQIEERMAVCFDRWAQRIAECFESRQIQERMAECFESWAHRTDCRPDAESFSLGDLPEHQAAALKRLADLVGMSPEELTNVDSLQEVEDRVNDLVNAIGPAPRDYTGLESWLNAVVVWAKEQG